MWKWTRDPLGFLEECHRDYGKTFTLRSPNVGAIVTTCDPVAVKEIFTAPQGTFLSRPSNEILKPIVGENSLFLLDGEPHRRQKALQFPMLNGSTLRGYGDVMVSATQRELSRWGVGETVNIQQAAERISIEIICKVVYGVADSELESAADTIRRLTHALTPKLLFFPALRTDLGAWSPGGKLKRAFKDVQSLLGELISERRKQHTPGTDILSMLVHVQDEEGEHLSDAEIADHLLTLLNAGHETTTSALSWLIHHLHKSPDHLDRLREEIESLGPNPDSLALAKAPWLAACSSESLRLVPTILSVGRTVHHPFELLGTEIPVGCRVMAAAYLSHRMEDDWEQPEQYNPTRFLREKPSPYVFYPFGGGARTCIGSRFAEMELRVIAGTLLSRTRLTLLDPGAEPVRKSVAVVPRGGVDVVVESRC